MMWKGLAISCDVTQVTLQMAWRIYVEEYAAEPHALVVTREDAGVALQLLADLKYQVDLFTLPIPEDSWFFCGPHGLVGSEGA